MDIHLEPTLSELQSRGIKIISLLYSARNCWVYQAEDSNLGCIVALKLQTYPYPVERNGLWREVEIQSKLQHQNIVQIYNYFSYNLNQHQWVLAIEIEMMVTDLAKDIDCRAKNNYPWEESQLFQFLTVMVDALAAAQELGIAHRDIKPQNIFKSQDVYKLGDFGSSKEQIEGMMLGTTVGTPYYLSPALKKTFASRGLRLVHNPFKSDVYSLGLTLLYMAMLKPLPRLEEQVILYEIQQLIYSDSMKQCLVWMLKTEESERPDFKTLRNFLQGSVVQAAPVPTQVCCVHLEQNGEERRWEAQCGHILCPSCAVVTPGNGCYYVTCMLCNQQFEYIDFQINPQNSDLAGNSAWAIEGKREEVKLVGNESNSEAECSEKRSPASVTVCQFCGINTAVEGFKVNETPVRCCSNCAQDLFGPEEKWKLYEKLRSAVPIALGVSRSLLATYLQTIG